MRFVGDVHGQIEKYLAIRGEGPSFQIGDMGLGFDGVNLPPSRNHRFIRGNHDCPELCRSHPNYAGEYGYKKTLGLFYAGGAFSIDKAYRLQFEKARGIKIWWENEELSERQLHRASSLYLKHKPEIVATHDCPRSVQQRILTNLVVGFRPEKDAATRTGAALQSMFESHQPKTWIFGHYHIDLDFEFAGTRFICLSELSVIDL